MYMVMPLRTLQDFNIVRATNFADQFTQTDTNLASQNYFALFGAPDELVLQVKTRMRAGATVFHANNFSQRRKT